MAAGRKQKGEHLFKRGRLWYGWVNEPVPGPDGRRVRYRRVKCALGTASIELARERLAQLEKDAADPVAARLKGATFGDAWDLHDQDRKALVLAGKRSRASLEFYDMMARAWLLFAGRRLDRVPPSTPDDALDKARKLELRTLGREMALQDFDRNFRDAFVAYRRSQGTSENTIGKNLTEMRSALYLAKVDGKWSGDLDLVFPPFESGYRPKRVTMSHDDARRLLAQFDRQPHHRGQVAFVLATGAEVAAILRARRDELDRIPLPVHGTKTDDRERFVPVVHDWQRELLDVARAGMDGVDGLAFKEWLNSSRDLAAACTAADVRVVSLHGLRHVYTDWSLNDGISETETAKALGHRDTRQIMRTYDDRQGDIMQRRAEEQAAARRQVRLQVIEVPPASQSGSKAAE